MEDLLYQPGILDSGLMLGRAGTRLLVLVVLVLIACFMVGIFCLLNPKMIMTANLGWGLDGVAEFVSGIAEALPKGAQYPFIRGLGVVLIVVPSVAATITYKVYIEPYKETGEFDANDGSAMLDTSEVNWDTVKRQREEGAPGTTSAAPPVATPAPAADPAQVEKEIDRLVAQASASWRQGNQRESLAAAEHALNLCRQNLGDGHPKTQSVQQMVAGAKAAAGQP